MSDHLCSICKEPHDCNPRAKIEQLQEENARLREAVESDHDMQVVHKLLSMNAELRQELRITNNMLKSDQEVINFVQSENAKLKEDLRLAGSRLKRMGE